MIRAPWRRRRPVPARRRCQICCARLEVDEPRGYCQDCYTIVELLNQGRHDDWVRLLPWSEWAARQARIGAHSARVESEIHKGGE